MSLCCTFTVSEFLADPAHSLLDDGAADLVAQGCRAADRRAVWIEGFSQSGKSCFADLVGQRLGWRVVHLDELAFRDDIARASYAEAIDPSQVQKTLGTPQRCEEVVIEGICLRDVMHSLADRRRAFVIYLMRVGNPAGRLIWYDAAEFNDARAQLNWVDQSAHDYHRRARPQGDADLTFARIE